AGRKDQHVSVLPGGVAPMVQARPGKFQGRRLVSFGNMWMLRTKDHEPRHRIVGYAVTCGGSDVASPGTAGPPLCTRPLDQPGVHLMLTTSEETRGLAARGPLHVRAAVDPVGMAVDVRVARLSPQARQRSRYAAGPLPGKDRREANPLELQPSIGRPHIRG